MSVVSWVMGDLRLNTVEFPAAPTTAGAITAEGTQLVLQETGDVFGSVKLTLANRNGLNGSLLENPSIALADCAYKVDRTITNVAITSNVLTVTMTASTLPGASWGVGQTLTLTGLTTATFLNGAIVTLLTVSATQFTAAFTHADYASAVDTGTAYVQNNVRMESRPANVVSVLNTGGEIQFVEVAGAPSSTAWFASGRNKTTIASGDFNLATGNFSSVNGVQTPFGGFGRFQNLAIYSEQFDNGVWTKTTGVTVTADNVAAPDGRTTADKIAYNGTGTSGSYRIYQTAGTTTNGVVYTYSIWLRADVATTVRLNNNLGTFVSCSLTSQWQRFSVTGTGDGVGAVQLLIYSDVSNNASFTIYAWGAQIETASTPGVYIRTVGSAYSSVDYGVAVAEDLTVAGNEVVTGSITAPFLVLNGSAVTQVLLDVAPSAQTDSVWFRGASGAIKLAFNSNIPQLSLGAGSSGSAPSIVLFNDNYSTAVLTLSGATGQITSGMVGGTGAVLTANNSTTTQKWIQISNTGNAGLYIGVESSVGGAFFTGSAAYDSVIYSPPADLLINTNSIKIVRLISKYNNITTVSNGVPAEYAKVDLTGQTANIGATTLYAVPASGAGMYRISAYVVETTAASVSSTLPNVQILYTDPDTNTVITMDVTPVLGAAGIGQTGALTGNTVGLASAGVVVISAKASTNIQHQTVNYASTAAGMAYSVRLKLEAL